MSKKITIFIVFVFILVITASVLSRKQKSPDVKAEKEREITVPAAISKEPRRAVFPDMPQPAYDAPPPGDPSRDAILEEIRQAFPNMPQPVEQPPRKALSVDEVFQLMPKVEEFRQTLLEAAEREQREGRYAFLIKTYQNDSADDPRRKELNDERLAEAIKIASEIQSAVDKLASFDALAYDEQEAYIYSQIASADAMLKARGELRNAPGAVTIGDWIVSKERRDETIERSDGGTSMIVTDSWNVEPVPGSYADSYKDVVKSALDYRSEE